MNGTRSHDPSGVARERELKFAVTAGFELPRLDDLAANLVGVPERELHLDATYYDTDDLQLARAGITLRHRNDEGWTVKLPAGPPKGTALQRDEVHFPGGPDGLPEGARHLVRALVRGEALVPVATLHTERRRTALVTLEGTPCAEVTDDTVTARPARGAEVHFREIEIELHDAATDTLVAAIARQMRGAGAGRPDPVPKLVRVLGPRTQMPLDTAVPFTLDLDSSGGALVRAAIAGSVTRLLRHDPRVRLGGDPEDVHQARVATRRLRSDLRTFHALLDPGWSDELRGALRHLGAVLGEVRDVEVLTERLERRIDALAEPDREAAKPVLHLLAQRHDAGRGALLELLDSGAYVTLLDRLVDAAQRPVLVPAAHEAVRDLLAPVMRRPWKRLTTAVRELGDDPPDPALHRVRILAKRTRYAAEALAPAVGRPAYAFAARIAAVQDVLGEHQDAVVCAAWLRRVADDLDPPARFVAGQLVAIEVLDARRHRGDWHRAWNRASKARLRRWW